ncbi:DEDD exonuclease domain-containing protein [Cumulibacter soli]|uniref:DEDD exonuclease domain-containing protein n=1 Tax=Cumulibacter soli TaxID=2546344 RepID=UPI001067EC49|nr:DEDD exonuclease domain-containing protein [Cumulibacter soli]
MPHLPAQLSIDEIGEPLSQATFLVVDLETTGGSRAADAITEIGAVKSRGGEVLGEFHTLVNPQAPIDPYVQVLTGITDRMVDAAPPITGVLPTFLEFAGLNAGTIVVAHNAGFDLGFLKAAARATDLAWPRHRTLDTLQLARRVLVGGEVPNHKLGTLAAHLGAATTPTHRALDDARATLDVLHALLERIGGSNGVHTVDELLALLQETTPAQRAKRTLADPLTTGPGVYIFRDAQGAALYVGKSSSVRRRVRAYFTASEPRARMREMVQLATKVDVVECAHDLEAQIREVRLIDALAPRYNRRSKNARSSVWLRLTSERFPRLSIVHRRRDGELAQIGPFGSRGAATAAMDAIHESNLVRRCTDRITTTTAPTPCALAELGRCSAPCTGTQTPEQYAAQISPIIQSARADPSPLLEPLHRRIQRLSDAERFEDAAQVRDRARSLVSGLSRTQQLEQLGSVARMVLAAPATGGRWDLAVITRGRLAAAAVADRTSSVLPIARELRATEQHFPDDATEAIAHEYEETRLLARWMISSGARLVDIDGELVSPASSAQRYAHAFGTR